MVLFRKILHILSQNFCLYGEYSTNIPQTPSSSLICAINQTVTRSLTTLCPGFDYRLGHVGFVANQMALELLSSEHFSYLCHFSFHQLLNNRPVTRLYIFSIQTAVLTKQILKINLRV